MGLIRHYRLNPGTQRAAADALDLPQQLVSKQTRVLIDAGVVIEAPNPNDGRARHCSVDEARAINLAAALVGYTLGVNEVKAKELARAFSAEKSAQ